MSNTGATVDEAESGKYPSERTLELIAKWPEDDLPGLFKFLADVWSDYGRIWEEDGFIKVSTGGWSGNEEIMSALRSNTIVWSFTWHSSYRGGFTLFRLPSARRPVTRVITLSKCEHCPHYNFDDQEKPERWGKHWCDHPKGNLQLHNDGGELPPSCPLP